MFFFQILKNISNLSYVRIVKGREVGLGGGSRFYFDFRRLIFQLSPQPRVGLDLSQDLLDPPTKIEIPVATCLQASDLVPIIRNI